MFRCGLFPPESNIQATALSSSVSLVITTWAFQAEPLSPRLSPIPASVSPQCQCRALARRSQSVPSGRSQCGSCPCRSPLEWFLQAPWAPAVGKLKQDTGGTRSKPWGPSQKPPCSPNFNIPKTSSRTLSGHLGPLVSQAAPWQLRPPSTAPPAPGAQPKTVRGPAAGQHPSGLSGSPGEASREQAPELPG